jgi:hypothetical protein
MKYLAHVACFLIVMSTATCTSNQPGMLSGVEVPVDRIASEETQYPDEGLCLAAASGYSYPDKPTSASPNKKIYSFKVKHGIFSKKSEVRYTVDLSAPQEGRKITYWEVSFKPTADDDANGRLMEELVKKLTDANEAVVIQPLFKDEKVNGKYSWRVFMRANKIINYKSNKFIKLSGDFGLIINPPYPP